MSDDNVIDINTNVEEQPDVLEPTHEEILGFLHTLEYIRSLSWFEEGKIDFSIEHLNIEITRFKNDIEMDIMTEATGNITKTQTLTEAFEVDFNSDEIDTTLVYEIQDGLEELRQCEED